MGWRLAARIAALLIALATGVAGALLLVPHAVDIGMAIPDHYPVVGGFLLTSAVLTTVCALRRLTGETLYFALFAMPLFVISVLVVVLAGHGIAVGRPWFALLVIPAIGPLLVLLSKKQPPYAEVGPEEVGITPQSGQYATALESLRSAGIMTIASVAYVASFWSVPVGVVVFAVLKAELLGPVPMGVTAILAKLAAQNWFIFIGILLTVVSFAGTLYEGLAARWRMLGVPDGNRLLSLKELAFIENAFEQTAEYADRAHYPERNWSKIAATALINLVVIALFIKAFIWIVHLPLLLPKSPLWFSTPFEPGATFAVLAASCGALLISNLPTAVLASLWRRHGEWLGWQRLVGRHQNFGGLTDNLLFLVRKHRQDITAPFDSGRYLQRQGQYVSLSLIAFFALGLAVAPLAVFHDRSKIDVVGQDGIDLKDWALRPTHFELRDVRKQVFSCVAEKHGRKIMIDLYLRGDRKLGLGDPSTGKLSGLVQLDDALRRQRTPISFYVDDKHRWLYDPVCVRAEAASYKGADAERVKRLLHLDDWERLTKKH